MSFPVWVTSAGSLGIVPENNFYEYQLVATGNALTFSFISGQMPTGIQLTRDGVLKGVPVVLDSTDPTNRSFEFTIRATNNIGKVSDRTFGMTISNIVPPTILSTNVNLGDYFDGQYFTLQLEAIEPAVRMSNLVWTIINGSLPPGLTMDSSGLISGFLYPAPEEGDTGLTGFQRTPYSELGYDNAPYYRNQTYKFVASVTDGINTSNHNYFINVTAKGKWSADNDIDLVSDDNLTIDHDNIYVPIIITPTQALPSVRANSHFAFKFDAIDPNYDEIAFLLTNPGTSPYDENGTDNQVKVGANWVFSGGGLALAAGGTTPGTGFDSTGFDQEGLSLPPGLLIDSSNGWFSGYIPSQAETSITYTITIQAYKVSNPLYASLPVTYELTVLGDIDNIVTWTTPSDLGIIDNGTISEFSVTAVSKRNKPLVYSIAPPSQRTIKHYGITNPSISSKLPQGLSLLPSGLISGRVSFNYYTLDAGTTTVDKNNITFDDTYTFTVLAKAVDGSASATQTFTIRVKNYNLTPYENLYLKALPTLDQRQTFLDIVNNKDIFPDSLMYRIDDPWFGRAKDIRSLFLAGLSPSELSDYIASMGTNHYNKRIEFGAVQTARAVDENFNTKYEVVYIPLIDNAVFKGKSPANRNLIEYENFVGIVYPNSFQNMQDVVSTDIGYANRGAIPNWMTAPQANQRVLGFTRAIVLAYTVPDAANLIAYRMKANGIVFNNINFVADRYDLDNALSANFDITNGIFKGVQQHLLSTTFDRIYKTGDVKSVADYAVSVPFNSINNQTFDTIVNNGGMDGSNYFSDGQQILFFKQEYPVPHNGWVMSDGTLIPGYLEHSFNSSIQNKAGGIWEIKIDPITTIVTLAFVKEVQIVTQVQINRGNTHASSVIFYNPSLQGNNSLPAYSTVPAGIANPTIFDSNKTIFIADRDVYEIPEQGDSYLKFPDTVISSSPHLPT